MKTIMILTIPRSGSSLLQALIANFIGIPENWSNEWRDPRWVVNDNDTRIIPVRKCHFMGESFTHDAVIYIQRNIIDILNIETLTHYKTIGEDNIDKLPSLLNNYLTKIIENESYIINSPVPRIIVKYDKMLNKPKEVLEDINRFMGHESNFGNMNLLKKKKNIDHIFEVSRNIYGVSQSKNKLFEKAKKQTINHINNSELGKRAIELYNKIDQLEANQNYDNN